MERLPEDKVKWLVHSGAVQRVYSQPTSEVVTEVVMHYGTRLLLLAGTVMAVAHLLGTWLGGYVLGAGHGN